MNNFCYQFNHNFKLPSREEIFPDGKPKVQSILDKTLMDPELFRILWMVDIDVRWIEVSYKIALPAHVKQSNYGSVHADGPEIDNKAKINFIIGGTDSAMVWHEMRNNSINENFTGINTSVLRVKNLKNITEVHREKFKAAIINCGQIHSIENTVDDRISLQCILQDLSTRERLDFSEAVRRFQMIESLVNPAS